MKASLQYYGGIVFEKSLNKPHPLANAILSCIIVALLGGPKFLCKMLPVGELDSTFIFEQI